MTGSDGYYAYYLVEGGPDRGLRYRYNTSIGTSQTTSRLGRKLGEIRNQSRKYMFHDGLPAWSVAGNGKNDVYWTVHSGGANFIWVDGHASWQKEGDWQDSWHYYDQ